MVQVWDCPLCGQVVEIGSEKLPPDYFESCRLREQLVGDECLAYRDLERARQILLGQGNEEALRQRRNVGCKCGGETFEPP